MMKAGKRKTIAVFLDYDGTLSPIVDDPDRAFMSDEVIKLQSQDSLIIILALINHDHQIISIYI